MKSKIMFFDYFWNIIIGCKEHCFYCIAKKHITDKIVFYKSNLEMFNNKKNLKIFCNPYSEPFYWDKKHLDIIIEYIKKNKDNEYWMFTKYPEIFDNLIIPNNLYVTYSITNKNDLKKIKNKLSDKIWISFAPLLSIIDLKYIKKYVNNIFLCKKDKNKFNYNIIKQSFKNVIEI